MKDITKYQGVIPAFYACYDEKGEISTDDYVGRHRRAHHGKPGTP